MAAYPLVLTKFAFPLTPEPHVVRGRVLSLLEEAWTRKVTLVCAGAGYGKSTAVSDLCRLCEVDRSVWYTLDPQDGEPGTFLSRLVVSLSRRVPELAEPLLSADAVIAGCAARAGGAESHLEIWHPALSLIINASLEYLRRDIVVVLDDYHEIAGGSAVHELTSYLIERFPPQIHLIVCSRYEPPLALARSRAQGQLLELGESELRVDRDEARNVLSSAFSGELPSDVVGEVIERSEGWITGVALAARAFSRRKGEDWGALLDQSRRHAAGFLLEQVDAAESRENRRLLREIAVFTYVYPELCRIYLGREDAGKLLAEMAGRNLFLRRMEGPRQAYQIHSLFRKALLGDLAVHGGAEAVRALHRRAGDSLARLGLWGQAVPHLLAAREWARAVQAVDLAAPELLASGRIRSVWKWLEELPDLQSGQTACVAELNRARVLRMWGRSAEAAAAADRAEAFVGDWGEHRVLRARLLMERSELAALTGGYAEARRLADETLALLANARETGVGAGQEAETGADADNLTTLLADAHAMIGACAAYGGAGEECLRYFKRAEQLYHEAGDAASEAEMMAREATTVYEVRGEFRSGIQALEKAARLARAPAALLEAGRRSRLAADASRID